MRHRHLRQLASPKPPPKLARMARDDAAIIDALVETETWEASDHLVCTVEPPSPKNGSTGRQILAAEDMCEPKEYVAGTDEARARIAACAPEALRMLIEIQNFEGGLCLWCRHPSCGDQHEPDCKWDALMRKAGLR